VHGVHSVTRVPDCWNFSDCFSFGILGFTYTEHTSTRTPGHTCTHTHS
jgi:hypothetical protein